MANAGFRESRPGIKLWGLTTGKEQTFQGHTETVCSVVFCPDGKSLASASRDKTVKLWDVAMGKEQTTFEGHKQPVVCVAFSLDGKTLTFGRRAAADVKA